MGKHKDITKIDTTGWNKKRKCTRCGVAIKEIDILQQVHEYAVDNEEVTTCLTCLDVIIEEVANGKA